MVGLRLVEHFERDLPNCNRYLPISPDKDEPLGKRMRTETILTSFLLSRCFGSRFVQRASKSPHQVRLEIAVVTSA